MESIISTFHIDWKIIIAQAINFGVVFTVLYVFALKPLNKLMTERAEKIGKGVDDAKKNEEMLKMTRAEYDATLAKAKAEASNIFEEGKKEALTRKSMMLEDAKADVAIIIENGKKMLEIEKTKTLEEAKKEIVTLAIQATEKLLGAKIDSSLSGKTIKELENL